MLAAKAYQVLKAHIVKALGTPNPQDMREMVEWTEGLPYWLKPALPKDISEDIRHPMEMILCASGLLTDETTKSFKWHWELWDGEEIMHRLIKILKKRTKRLEELDLSRCLVPAASVEDIRDLVKANQALRTVNIRMVATNGLEVYLGVEAFR